MANTKKLPLTEHVLSTNDKSSLISRVQTFLQEESLSTLKLCVGLSGGLDSVVLLHILVQCQQLLPLILSAVHINHGISPNAVLWSRFTQQYAAELGVLCHMYAVRLERKGGESLEAVARKARYDIYCQQECDAIVLAHHQDDQAETVLLQLMRGSGVVGLAAMPKKRTLSPSMFLIRPLLEASRAELLAYAQTHQLTWMEDESNTDIRYQRNFLRHEIFPRLSVRYPDIAKTLGRAAHYFAQTSDLLADFAKIDCPEITSGAYIRQEVLRTLSPMRQRNALYWYLRAKNIFPDEKGIREIQKAIHVSATDKMPTFSMQGKDIYLAQGVIAVVPTFIPPQTDIILYWHGESVIDVPAWQGQLYFTLVAGIGLPVDRLSSPLILKPRQGGEKIKLGPDRPHQTVKNLWQANHIPSWQRQRLPFIWGKNGLIMVPGAGTSCEEVMDQDGQGIQITWAPRDFTLP
jgi:tRNA(Ile)-lysidine synthase